MNVWLSCDGTPHFGPLAGYGEFVFFRAEEIDSRTGSDLLGVGSAMRRSLDSHSITGWNYTY